MDLSERAYQKHTQKIIESYLSWTKCLSIDIEEAIIARQCVEHILKALVVKEKIFDIITFDITTFKRLCRDNHIPPHIKAFGGSACLHLLKENRKNLLTPQLCNNFKDIIDAGNKSAHGAEGEALKLADTIDEKLFYVSDWFFRIREWKLDWKETRIDPEIKNIENRSTKEIAKQTRT